jgi:hypothetical protein
MSCYRVALIFIMISFMAADDCLAVSALSTHDIHSMDFYNFTYEDCKAYGGHAITLRKGEYIHKGSVVESRSKLLAVKYADLNADGRDEAVIDIRTMPGGSIPYIDDYYVFQYRKGVLIWAFHISREWPRGMVVGGRSITIVAPFWEDGTGPMCCPPFIETIVYRWRGSRLIVVGRRLRKKHYPGMSSLRQWV